MVLVSEPVRGRSRATELPCLYLFGSNIPVCPLALVTYICHIYPYLVLLSPAGAGGPGTGDIATPPVRLLSPAGAVGPGMGDIATPPPSVCLSVCPSRLVFALELKNALLYFPKLCRYVHQVMRVCCIVLILMECCFNFL